MQLSELPHDVLMLVLDHCEPRDYCSMLETGRVFHPVRQAQHEQKKREYLLPIRQKLRDLFQQVVLPVFVFHAVDDDEMTTAVTELWRAIVKSNKLLCALSVAVKANATDMLSFLQNDKLRTLVDKEVPQLQSLWDRMHLALRHGALINLAHNLMFNLAGVEVYDYSSIVERLIAPQPVLQMF